MGELPNEVRLKCLFLDGLHQAAGGDDVLDKGREGLGVEHFAVGLVGDDAGIAVVIAKSFARIFYRKSINIGLPIMECPEAVDAISAGDTVSVDFTTGLITDETTGKTFQAEPFPPFIQKIIADGGVYFLVSDFIDRKSTRLNSSH